MNRDHLTRKFGIALVSLAATVATASAADSFSNSLTGFTGNSTQAATQTALMNAGFTFSDTDATNQVDFSANGAAFGTGLEDNHSRNYLRTIDDDYANHSFIAEITVITPDSDPQDVYIGIGSGTANPDFFRIADLGTDVATVMYFGENEPETPNIQVLRSNDGTERSVFLSPAPGLGDGTYRMRLDYNWFKKTAVYSFDLDYVGGPFVADLTVPALSTVQNYSPTGWPSEPSRIFFGGDQGAAFRDLEVTVTSDAFTLGDFTGDHEVTSADWMVLRANQHKNLSGLTASEAYLLGDFNGDMRNDFEDFRLFKVLFESINGEGSFTAMLSGVPEPSTLLLAFMAGLFAFPRRRPISAGI